MPEEVNIGKFIGDAIRDRGISKSELSRRCKVSVPTINAIINGGNAETETLRKLGEVLGFVLHIEATGTNLDKNPLK